MRHPGDVYVVSADSPDGSRAYRRERSLRPGNRSPGAKSTSSRDIQRGKGSAADPTCRAGAKKYQSARSRRYARRNSFQIERQRPREKLSSASLMSPPTGRNPRGRNPRSIPRGRSSAAGSTTARRCRAARQNDHHARSSGVAPSDRTDARSRRLGPEPPPVSPPCDKLATRPKASSGTEPDTHGRRRL